MSIKTGPIANPEIGDKILEAIYNIKGMVGTEKLSKQLSLEQTDVVKVIYAINKNEDLIRTDRGYGNDQLLVGMFQRKEDDVIVFLKSGGFTAISKNNQQEIQSQTERNNLELEHLKLEIANLHLLPSEQKRTRQLSRAAILISLATVLFEIWKTLFLKP